MRYYAILLLGLIGILAPLRLAFLVSQGLGSYLYGAIELSIAGLLVWSIYRKWGHEKGAFASTVSSLTAIVIVDCGMIYAALAGIHPN